ncbi:MAG: M15 family metallopeptidase [Gammaproteobacteria bacterium]|nr:M15 family metallopeptidase [Gammaproteobacteria bacterium]
MQLSPEQLTGQVETHLVYAGDGRALQTACWEAFGQLQQAAIADGFDLQIASAFRSFERQLEIWNSKVRGERPVHDDQGVNLDLDKLEPLEKVHAIMRFSALPGASRHHWGTDLDVFDAAVVPVDYQVQLSPAEVAPDGIFAGLHAWLDVRIAADQAFGFERPYGVDGGGVAPERWHLSYAPLARDYLSNLTVAVLVAALRDSGLELLGPVLEHLPEIHRRYVRPPSSEDT